MGSGSKAFVFNPHELATVWHFPMAHVKTPLIQKVETKQSEPPIGLPIEEIDLPFGDSPIPEVPLEEKKKENHLDAFGYHDEQQFG